MRALPPQGGMRKPPGGPGRDVLLQNNPDFEIPGIKPLGRVGNGGGGGMRGVGGGPMMAGHSPGGMMQQSAVPPNGLTGVGRYPAP